VLGSRVPESEQQKISSLKGGRTGGPKFRKSGRTQRKGGIGAMTDTKPYKLIRVWGHECEQTLLIVYALGAMDVNKPF
jgi:hypothetical protein